MDILLMVLLQLALILLNAIFACAEIAVIQVSEGKLSLLAEEGDKRAVRLKKLTTVPAKFLATIQVAITLAGFLGSAFAADNFSPYLVQLLKNIHIPLSDGTLKTISVILITFILSYLSLIFGELVPKRLAMRNAEKIALGLSGILLFISRIFAPLVWLLTASTNGVLRLLDIDPNSVEEEASEEDIRMMVDIGAQNGTIDTDERELIQNVFEFDDTTAGEIATHRTDVSLLWMDETPEEWDKTIHDSRHTLYPVCEETVDHIVGVLNAKDYFRLEDKSRDNVMANAVKPAYLVPESVKADVLFNNMKKEHTGFAIVLDEYGGMAGIVTMNDLIECIVGDFDDAVSDSQEEEKPLAIETVDSHTWRIRGDAELSEVEEALGVKFDAEDCDTFGGLVFSAYGSIPEDGTTFEVNTCGLVIKVTDVQDHQVVSALVCREDPKTDSDSDNATDADQTKKADDD